MYQNNVNNKYRTQFINRQRELFRLFLTAYAQAVELITKPEQQEVLIDLAETFNFRQVMVTMRIETDPMFAINTAIAQPFGFSPRSAMPIGHTVSYATCTTIDDNGQPDFIEPAVAVMNEALVPLEEAVESIKKFAVMLGGEVQPGTGE